ncbi:MAG: ATP-binding protein [Lachnospira sp.]
MLFGRTEEMAALEADLNKNENTLTVLYGRTNIGKTTLVKGLIKGRINQYGSDSYFYYATPLASEREQVAFLRRSLVDKGYVDGNTGANMGSGRTAVTDAGTGVESTAGVKVIPEDDYYAEYARLLSSIVNQGASKKLIIIEEFQNIVKSNKEFMAAIADMVKGKFFNDKVTVILTSSSVSWVENSMVSAIGTNALAITSFLKLKELDFVDIVRMFPGYTVLDDMVIYAITGGVPGYLSHFSDKLSLKENICRSILRDEAKLRNEGGDYIKEELRETSLYNTILYCIANGENKLNELHQHTGFGRDKISVYLKNLIEREIVEKIFSYDIGGREHTKKGLYRIKSGYTEFWFKYIYANESELNILTAEAFYEKYIADSIYAFAKEAFIRVGTEFIELLDSMGRLEIKIDRRGRWWGKNGDIDIIACDEEENYLVGKCNWDTDVFTFEMFEELMLEVNLAGIAADYIYLFSKDTFDDEVLSFAEENDNVKLVSLKDL